MAQRLLDRQAERMHRLTKELLRKYQLRDRNEITCGGVSISQCYALDLLGDNGETTMLTLAQKMFLDKSTTSRVVDPLVKRGLVARRLDSTDRRIVLVGLTATGKKLLSEIRACQLTSQRQILERIAAGQRQRLIKSLELLSRAVQDWLASCCLPNRIHVTTTTKRSSHA